MENSYLNDTREQKANLREEFEKYLKYWPWFLFWMILALAGGFFYLRYTTPIYQATASIIIKEENGKTLNSDLSSYSDLALLGSFNTNSIENEMAILKSRRIMTRVVNALNLHIQYFKTNDIRTVELYNELPYTIKILKTDEKKLQEAKKITLILAPAGDDVLNVFNPETQKTYRASLGAAINIDFADVVFVENENWKNSLYNSNETIITVTDPDKMASYYREEIRMSHIDKNSNVIELVLKDAVKEKAEDIIDQIILEFNRDAIEGKNLIAGNTANFINERLDIINSELESVETGKEQFKESHRLTDIQAESQMFIQNASEYNHLKQQVGTQIELSNAMLEYLSTSSKSDLLPANLGIEEVGVNQQIGDYNNLVLERNRILEGSTEKNPVVVRLNSQIDQIKGNISMSLQRMRSNLQISQDDLNRQSSSIGSRILAVPSQEREYRGIERQQNIKETLYLFLLQKREENSLSLAVTAPKAKIVDMAYSSGEIISPGLIKVLFGSFAIGFFIPFSFIYVKDIMNNKVRSKTDIESLVKDCTFLGELPKVRKKAEFLISQNDRSMISESFRILITNLQYLLVNATSKDRGIKILVTSTVKGEGKTFTSINLGITLANTGKKVLIVGADLRNPKLQEFLPDNETFLGVSDYLVSDTICLAQLIKSTSFHQKLKILPSGTIPPNPSELLRQDKMEEMFQNLEEFYDYIIVDSAPSLLVTDTFIISRFMDLTLYVVRAGYTEKRLIQFAADASKSGSLPKLSFVLNSVEISNLGYGNKYGYGYGEHKNNFWGSRKPSKNGSALKKSKRFSETL